jgi:two-component system cell cycle response regulator DivK
MNSSPQAHRRVVLIVDDDLPLLEFLREALELQGFDVLAASNPFIAVRLAAMNTPDLVVMDIDMPGMEGTEAAKHLKKIDQTREIPVIAFTGRPSSSLVDHQSCGFTRIVLKDGGLEPLQQGIEEALRGEGGPANG